MCRHLKTIFVAILIAICLPLSALAIEVYFSPQEGAQKRIVELINEAEKSVDIAMYGFTSPEVAEAIVKAHRRGVQIRIVLDRTQAAGKESQSDYLQKHGLDVRLDHQKGIMHNKVGIIDRAVLITGSYNWTKSAEDVNQENLLIITVEDDEEVVKKYRERFEYLWQLNLPTNNVESILKNTIR